MMKKYLYFENPLNAGMRFASLEDVVNVIYVNNPNSNRSIRDGLDHYCKWHTCKETKEIVIDELFDEVKPFTVGVYKYDIGEKIVTNTGEYIITDRCIKKDLNRNGNARFYICECVFHQYAFELMENRISQGIGCPICGNRKILPGIRSLYDVRPDLLKYICKPDIAKNLTPYSNKKVLCRCPECGNTKKVIVHNLNRFGFSCDICSDHISYPNKFVRCFLEQCGIEFVPEKQFCWSDKKVYDQYIPQYNMIIENHGIQHFEELNSKMFPSLQKQIENDIYKKDLAIQNNINYYIVLDCRESDMEFIKKSIIESELQNILHVKLDKIDWDFCDKMASTNSEIIKACDLYNNVTNNITEIAEILQHDKHTISNYLEIGAKCGYCNFEKNNNKINGRSNLRNIFCKPIYCVDDNIYFFSKDECENYYKSNGIPNFSGYNLYAYINNNKPYKNKLFKYISKAEYNRVYDNKDSESSIVIGDRYKERYIKED